jgi:hypothetical protein
MESKLNGRSSRSRFSFFEQLMRKTFSSLNADGFIATIHKIIRYVSERLENRFVGLFWKHNARLKKLLPENRWGDQAYGFLKFYASHRRRPNNSMTFNDVLYRIKTTDEILDPLRIFVTDKEFVKLYIKAVVGDEYNVPTLAVLRSVDDVRAYSFPSQCCIKPTHGFGKVILRKDDAPIDYNEIESWFSQNFYPVNREANYRLLKPKIIIEPIIFPEQATLVEYKIFCFQGEPRLIITSEDYLGIDSRNLFDIDWNNMPFALRKENNPNTLSRPTNLLEMLNMARKLSERFDFIRVDFYSDNKKIYVGELTNCHVNASRAFIPINAEKIASKIIFDNSP